MTNVRAVMLSTLFPLSLVSWLAACAALPTSQVAEASRCDQVRMDAVERASIRRGTELHWVNCPQAPSRAATEHRP